MDLYVIHNVTRNDLTIDSTAERNSTSFDGNVLTITKACPFLTNAHCRQTTPGRGVGDSKYRASTPSTVTLRISSIVTSRFKCEAKPMAQEFLIFFHRADSWSGFSAE